MQLTDNLNENVYYILLDGYASKKTFSRMSNDNQYFYNFLDANNFKMLGDKASYNTTYLSLTSLFLMDYPLLEGDKAIEHGPSFFPFMLNRIKAPPLIEKLKLLNYDFIFYGNAWSNCNPRHVKCGQVSNDFTFPKWITYQSFTLFSKTAFGGLIKYNFDYDAMGSFIDAHKNKIAQRNSEFYFIHQLSPHPPYLSEDCKTIKAQTIDTYDPPEDYISTVNCVNKQVMDLISLLNQKDPTAFIVIQSDHGPDTNMGWLSDKTLDESVHLDNKLSIINVMKSPQQCDEWLKDNIGPVNTTIFILACIDQSKPSYVDDKSFIGLYPHDENFNGQVREYIHIN
jgi:hypothetical protein